MKLFLPMGFGTLQVVLSSIKGRFNFSTSQNLTGKELYSLCVQPQTPAALQESMLPQRKYFFYKFQSYQVKIHHLIGLQFIHTKTTTFCLIYDHVSTTHRSSKGHDTPGKLSKGWWIIFGLP